MSGRERHDRLEHGAVAHMQVPVVGFANGDTGEDVRPRSGQGGHPRSTDRGRGDGVGFPRRCIACAMESKSCCSVSCGSTRLGRARCENFSSAPAVPKSRFFPNFGHPVFMLLLKGRSYYQNTSREAYVFSISERITRTAAAFLSERCHSSLAIFSCRASASGADVIIATPTRMFGCSPRRNGLSAST